MYPVSPSLYRVPQKMHKMKSKDICCVIIFFNANSNMALFCRLGSLNHPGGTPTQSSGGHLGFSSSFWYVILFLCLP